MKMPAMTQTQRSRIKQTITGIVTHANDRGFKLDDNDEWINLSRFAGDLIPPFIGQYVVVGIDKDGFARSIDVSGTPQEAAVESQQDLPSITTSSTRLEALKLAVSLCIAEMRTDLDRTATADRPIFIAKQFETYLSGM